MRRSARPSTGSGRRRCSAPAARSSGSAGRGRSRCSSRRRRRSSCVVLPLTIATSAIGVYSLASTLLWGRFVFGIPFHVVHPFAFVVAVPATILGLGLLGLVFASTFVLYRNANALSNMLEWPVLLVTGHARAALAAARLGAPDRAGCSRRPGACAGSARRRSAAHRGRTSA